MDNNPFNRLNLVVLAVCVVLVPTAEAESRVELTPFVGYRFSGSIDNINSSVVNELSVRDAGTYGLNLGFYITEDTLIELLWSRQATDLRIRRQTPLPDDEIGLDVDHYHIGGVYVLADDDFSVRPFVSFSLGATYFAPQGKSSETRFSMSLGGGLRWFPTEHLGLRLQARWTPTYINSTSGGYFCDPFGCFTTTSSQYLQELDASLGLIIRF